MRSSPGHSANSKWVIRFRIHFPPNFLYTFRVNELPRGSPRQGMEGNAPPPSSGRTEETPVRGPRKPCTSDLRAARPHPLPLQLFGSAAARADVSGLEIPLPRDQGLQNKSSHRRKKLPAQPLARGSGFNHTAGEVIGRGPAAEGLPRARSSWAEGLLSLPSGPAGASSAGPRFPCRRRQPGPC